MCLRHPLRSNRSNKSFGVGSSGGWTELSWGWAHSTKETIRRSRRWGGGGGVNEAGEQPLASHLLPLHLHQGRLLAKRKWGGAGKRDRGWKCDNNKSKFNAFTTEDFARGERETIKRNKRAAIAKRSRVNEQIIKILYEQSSGGEGSRRVRKNNLKYNNNGSNAI